VAVQIYLCVTGSGSERAKVIQEFYDRAIKGEETKFSYPKIEPSVMASLSELFGVPLTVQDVMLRLLLTLKKKAGILQAGVLTDEELQMLDSYVLRVVERNDKFLVEANE
jgi:octanoyl-[GcvH]:protein N-octanoyltransferase